jgi:hypothetical protein
MITWVATFRERARHAHAPNGVRLCGGGRTIVASPIHWLQIKEQPRAKCKACAKLARLARKAKRLPQELPSPNDAYNDGWRDALKSVSGRVNALVRDLLAQATPEPSVSPGDASKGAE